MTEWSETRLWLLRHAPVNLPYIYGQMDVLADLDRPDEFAWLGRSLPKDAVVISSDLIRCVETAKAAGLVGIQQDPRLREQNFGLWQGLTYDQAAKKNPQFYDAFWQSPATLAPPEGESFTELFERVSLALADIWQLHAGRDVILVTHAGVIRAAIAACLGMDPDKALRIAIAPLSLSEITCYQGAGDPTFQVNSVNRMIEACPITPDR